MSVKFEFEKEKPEIKPENKMDKIKLFLFRKTLVLLDWCVKKMTKGYGGVVIDYKRAQADAMINYTAQTITNNPSMHSDAGWNNYVGDIPENWEHLIDEKIMKRNLKD